MKQMDIAAAERALRRMEKICCTAVREELPPAAQWLRDNARLLYSAAQQAHDERREYHKKAYRRYFAFCRKFIEENDGRVNEKLLYRAVQNAQEEQPFTVRELRATEGMLRICLLLRLHALLPKAQEECRAYRQGEALAQKTAQGEGGGAQEDPVLLCRALEILWESGDADAAGQLEALAQENGTDARALVHIARERCMRTAAQISQCIRSVKYLPRMDFGRLTEKMSVACRLLSQEETFCKTDKTGRALYLTAVQRLSERTGLTEARICGEALRLAKENAAVSGGCGYYLLEAPEVLLKSLGCPRRFAAGVRAHLLAAYIACQAAGFAVFGAAGFFVLPWWGVLPFAMVGAQLCRQLGVRLAARHLPARRLPRLQGGQLRRAGRCLLVIPTVLTDAHHALRMVRQLSVVYLANRNAPLDFMLLSDFTDAAAEETPQDEEVISALRMGIGALRDSYGERFHALHRQRTRSETEGCCCGHERKRGALLLLCRLILGEKTAEEMAFATLSPKELRGRYRYVITLDADTFLPAGAAEKMILTMLHPLQAGRKAVLQPRMATLSMHVNTRAQKLLFGMSGTDGYDGAAADFYQDAFCRGSFMGKGIFEPRAFLSAVGDLPDGRILSHDLLEGELAGSALMSDVMCCDGHPRTLGGFLKRTHRWTRGDWQLAPFLRDKRLDGLARYKIIDNLRLSLMPFMRMIALCAAARAGAFVPFLLALPPAFSLQALCETLLLPADAFTRLDAALRALWRMLVSGKRLLEWTTAAQSDGSDPHILREVLLPMLPGAFMLLCAAAGVHPAGFLLGAAWLTYPFWRGFFDAPLRTKKMPGGEDRAFLLQVAEDTLRFFRGHVNAATQHLPPDNVQLSPPRGAAMRTSPTNIGLYLLSLCAARKLQLMDSDEMLTRMLQTAETLEKMEKWHGHFYNWYDIQTLSPLPPRFVSAVDSGNCYLCLRAAAQCARRYMPEGDAAVRSVPSRLDALCRDMQLDALYDRREELFYIGYDAQRGEMTEGHYDLMASEALLLSYAAIAAGQVSERHWWRLGRVFTREGGKTLLSWSGTMFEYLMPALLLPAFPGTLLHAARRGCVRVQLRSVKDGPFGISESGYAQFDEQLHYAYKAFGVPELSLNGECPDGVRTPYAAALALLTHPKEATEALRQWKKRGVYGAQGFFEAEDFTHGDAPRIVCSHMAHHQGMILCAVCNALCEEDLTRLLFSLPGMRAHLPLLNESAPRRVRPLPPPLRAHRDAAFAAPLHLRAQPGLPPQMHVLSGGGLTMAQSAAGHGYLAQGEVLLTRFSRDCAELSGPQFYLRAVREGTTVRLTAGEYTFRDGDWRVSGALGALRTHTSGCVDPLTGAAVYRVRVRNLAACACRTEVTVYLEPCLETMKNDAAHRAFSDLFLSVSRTGAREITVLRRSREPGEKDKVLRLCALTAGSGAALAMNDRTAFIGRTDNLNAPRGTQLSEKAFVMQPAVEHCAALRLPLVVAAGREETLYFALGMQQLPGSEEEAARAFALCASRAQVLERMLRADARQTALLADLTPRLLFDGLPGAEKPPADVRQLWAQGVSGERPLIVIRPDESGREGSLRQALRLVSLAFSHGLPGEAILLLPEESGYLQPLRTLCETLLLQPVFGAVRERCRIVCRSQEDFCRAAQALCCLEIDCARDVRQQLAPRQTPPVLQPGSAKGTLPAIARLRHFNGYGGYTQEGGYTLLPAAHGGTMAPWSYILCSERFGTLVCEQGILYSHAGNSRLRRITKYFQDGVQITPSEEYLLLDEDGAYSITASPFAAGQQRVTYEMGTAVYECALADVHASLTCFADPQERAGGRLIKLRNTGTAEKRITLCAAVRFAMGEDGRGTQAYAQGDSVRALGGGMPGEAFFAMDGAQAHTAPSGAYAPGPAQRAPMAQGAGTVGILCREMLLPPGETGEITAVLGWGRDAAECARVRRALGNAKERLRLVRGSWAERLGKLQFFLPDDRLNDWMNTFLPYQIRASRLEMRAGFYQSGGAFGFRDQLQDMLSLVYTEPGRVREHLLLCASRQYEEGDVQHWWHPQGAGVRTRISDDKLFLPYVTARYVYVTGDREILACRVPYLRSPVLRREENDRYETAESTKETGSLLEHCLRSIDQVALGPQGIALMGGGDWNDGMNRVGGESAWLGFFYLIVLRDFAPLCDPKTRSRLDARAAQLEKSLRAAFRDRWFVRAWYEDGRSIGAWDSEVPRIDLISQCFAAFADMPRNQVISALDQAWERLHDADKGITYLMDPPFSPEENAGYIGAYLPGVRENGGQYTHAVPWFMRALLQYGRRERAWQLLLEILPGSHSFDLPSARRYRTEPYALAADVYRWGRGGWTWYTGSAAWLYDVFLRDFLGFDKRGNEVTLRPRVPQGWEEVTVLYRFGASRYQLTAGRDTRYVTLDGEAVRGGYVPLVDDGRAHEARFPLAE